MRIAIRSILASGGLVALAACSDPSGPGRPVTFDSQRVQDGLATVEQVGAAPVLKSFQALGGQIGAPAPDRYLAAVQRIAAQAELVPVIRSPMLGKTLTYDPLTAVYVVSDRTGAPANGVRFVLYEVDAESRPVVSKEIGVADLTDEKASSPTAAGLRLVVTSQGKTYLDYAFDVSGSIAAVVVNVDGYMSDGAHRVDFEITASGNAFEAELEVAAQQFKVRVRAEGEAGAEITITSGTDVVVISSTGTDTAIEARVTVNGKLFATVTGTPDNPVIKGDGGRELTAGELAALGELVRFGEGVFELLGGLMAPAAALLLLGLGL